MTPYSLLAPRDIPGGLIVTSDASDSWNSASTGLTRIMPPAEAAA